MRKLAVLLLLAFPVVFAGEPCYYISIEGTRIAEFYKTNTTFYKPLYVQSNVYVLQSLLFGSIGGIVPSGSSLIMYSTGNLLFAIGSTSNAILSIGSSEARFVKSLKIEVGTTYPYTNPSALYVATNQGDAVSAYSNVAGRSAIYAKGASGAYSATFEGAVKFVTSRVETPFSFELHGTADFKIGYPARHGGADWVGRALVDLGNALVVNYGPDWEETRIHHNKIKVSNQRTYIGNKVGIGVDNPQAPLEISTYNSSIWGGWREKIRLSDTYHAAITFYDTNNNYGWLLGFHGVNKKLYLAWISDWEGKVGSYLLAVDYMGKVGIGTTNPSEKLHVEGNIYLSGTLKHPDSGILWMTTNGHVRTTFHDGCGNFQIMAGAYGCPNKYVADNFGAAEIEMNYENSNGAIYLRVAPKGTKDRTISWITYSFKTDEFSSPTQIVAPKFVDSNNAAYFVDPSSATTSIKVKGKIEAGSEIYAKNGYGWTIYIGGDNAGNDLEIGTTSTDATKISFYNRASGTMLDIAARNIYGNLECTGCISSNEIADSTKFVSVQDASGVEKFAVTDGNKALRVAAGAGIGISFDAATHTITITNTGDPDPTDDLTGSGTAGYIAKFTGTNQLGNSVIYELNGKIGIGTTSPTEKLEVAGNIKATGDISATKVISEFVIPSTTAGTVGSSTDMWASVYAKQICFNPDCTARIWWNGTALIIEVPEGAEVVIGQTS